MHLLPFLTGTRLESLNIPCAVQVHLSSQWLRSCLPLCFKHSKSLNLWLLLSSWLCMFTLHPPYAFLSALILCFALSVEHPPFPPGKPSVGVWAWTMLNEKTFWCLLRRGKQKQYESKHAEVTVNIGRECRPSAKREKFPPQRKRRL